MRNKKYFFLMTLSIITTLKFNVNASTNGYGKFIGAGQKDKNKDKQSLWQTLFQIESEQKLSNELFFKVATHISFAKKSLSDLDLMINPQVRSPYHLTDPPKEIKIDKENSYVLYPNIERFSLNFAREELQVNIGRSAFSYGSARIFPASYFIAPSLLTNLALEHISAHDGIKLSYQKNLWPRIDLVHFSANFENLAKSLSLLRLHSLKANMQYEAMVGHISKIGFLGLSTQKSFSQISLWADYGLIIPKQTPLNRLTLGGEYFFSPLNQVIFEYHLNELTPQKIEIATKEKTLLTQESYLFLKDKHYFSLQWSHSPYPLIQNSLQVMSKQKLKESLWTVKSTINIKENSYLEFLAVLSSCKKCGDDESDSLEWKSLGSLLVTTLSYFW